MANPLSGIIGFFKKASEGRDESVIGIDAGSAYLKVVQLRRKGGRAVLETYGSIALGPYADIEVGRATRLPVDKLVSALQDLIREAHITATRGAIAIPLSSSLVMPIDMPFLPEKELASAVPIEARKFVPVPISEVDLDWWLIPDDFDKEQIQPAEDSSDSVETIIEPKKALRILFAAIHNDALARFKQVAKDSGLNVSVFEVEVFSSLRALSSDQLEPRVVLDFGAGDIKLSLVDKGLLRVSHAINHGAQDLTLILSRSRDISFEEAERLKRERGIDSETIQSLRGVLNSACSEASSVLRSFETRRGIKVKKLTLSGGGANLSGLPEFVSEICGIEVERADPFSHVIAPAFLDDTLRAAGPEFGVAIGAAFRCFEEMV